MRKAQIIGVLFITVLLVLGACVSTAPPPVRPKPLPPPTPAPLPATPSTLDGLAYIQAEGRPYSDDADPEPEGAEITILWYDTKSELIFFEDVPVKATIEIFAAKSEVSLARYTESVYKGEHHVDNYHSNIRIPFEQIKASPEIHYSGGRANIVVNTPQQGGFSVENILLSLYPKQPLKPPPIPAPLPAPTPAPLPSPAPEKPPTNIIEDLAYIQAVNIPYSDDADPEWEGYDVNLFWCNTKSELIHFRNIPMLVTIELFTAKYNVETKQREIVSPVYKAEAQIDSSSSRIRISFENINVDPSVDDCSGIGKVTVHTPQQGDFSFDMEYVLLYEPD